MGDCFLRICEVLKDGFGYLRPAKMNSNMPVSCNQQYSSHKKCGSTVNLKYQGI